MELDLSRRRVLAAGGGLAGSVLVGRVLFDGMNMSESTADTVKGWPMSRGNPRGTSYAPEATPPKDGVSVRWKERIGSYDDPAYPSPIVANGLVYGAGEELVCVESSSGNVVFRLDYTAGSLTVATASAYQSPTLSTQMEGISLGLDSRGGLSVGGSSTGFTRWQVRREYSDATITEYSEGPVDPAPIADDGTVFDVSYVSNTGIQAIDASSGRLRWRSTKGLSSPVVRDGTVFVVGKTESGRSELAGYDTETGKQTFSFQPEVAQGALLSGKLESVIAAPDFLITGTWDSGLWGVDYDDETRLWTYNPTELYLDRSPIPVAVADGIVYAGFENSDQNWLVAFDVANEAELWRTELPKGELGADIPAVANDVVYAPAGKKGSRELVAFDTMDGHVRWRFSPEDSGEWMTTAALAGDTLSVIGVNQNGDGHLYALEER